MATNFLSTANLFHLATPTYVHSNQIIKCNVKRESTICKVVNPSVTKRGISISFVSSLVLSLTGKGLFDANAAILEADDDLELLEKVKKDRIKRLEKQGVISSSTKETGYLQDVVYKLSEVGKAIEKNDLTTAGSVLGSGKDTSDWVQKANIALNKLSSSPEEKTEVDTFNSSLASLVSSVAQNDVKSSKTAFVSSAAAFEKWTSLTGLVGKLKGL
ncbi:thylakoid lumenal 16.5 kDa protein, chloroplastic [Vicia villosa]|uniref:thylakoid lumenal 16.5 kDa protein, chloroplastic n=1 Tax=Vicia villosa TaxID=3911 RepID=UPI00273C7C22|nr:thylakoid lumenal 16.5 kDa protein, chloroplastic [Vicia villosa]